MEESLFNGILAILFGSAGLIGLCYWKFHYIDNMPLGKECDV